MSNGLSLRAMEGPPDGAPHGVAVAYSPDGNTVASGGFEARLWRASDGVLLQALKSYAINPCVAFSPDGATFVTGDLHRAQVWQASDAPVSGDVALEHRWQSYLPWMDESKYQLGTNTDTARCEPAVAGLERLGELLALAEELPDYWPEKRWASERPSCCVYCHDGYNCPNWADGDCPVVLPGRGERLAEHADTAAWLAAVGGVDRSLLGGLEVYRWSPPPETVGAEPRMSGRVPSCTPQHIPLLPSGPWETCCGTSPDSPEQAGPALETDNLPRGRQSSPPLEQAGLPLGMESSSRSEAEPASKPVRLRERRDSKYRPLLRPPLWFWPELAAVHRAHVPHRYPRCPWKPPPPIQKTIRSGLPAGVTWTWIHPSSWKASPAVATLQNL